MPPGLTLPYVRSLRSVRRALRRWLVSGVADMGEQFGEASVRPVRARLDRADGDAEDLGDLGVREAVEPRQLDDAPFVLRQLVEGDAHLPRLPGRLQRHGGDRIVDLGSVDGASAPVAAVCVD